MDLVNLLREQGKISHFQKFYSRYQEELTDIHQIVNGFYPVSYADLVDLTYAFHTRPWYVSSADLFPDVESSHDIPGVDRVVRMIDTVNRFLINNSIDLWTRFYDFPWKANRKPFRYDFDEAVLNFWLVYLRIDQTPYGTDEDGQVIGGSEEGEENGNLTSSLKDE